MKQFSVFYAGAPRSRRMIAASSAREAALEFFRQAMHSNSICVSSGLLGLGERIYSWRDFSSEVPNLDPATLTLRGMESASDPSQKERHGCLTALLLLIIVANFITAAVYFIGRHGHLGAVPRWSHSLFLAENHWTLSREAFLRIVPEWALVAFAFLSIANIICMIVVLRWRRWGFFGFVGTGIVSLLINLMVDVNLKRVLFGLAALVIPAVLYGVLQLGKEKSGWAQLE